MTKHSLIPANIASKTEDINLYQPGERGHELVSAPRGDAPSLRDSQRNFQLRIGGSQPSFDMKFDYSKESGNEYNIGRKSPSIESRHFVERFRPIGSRLNEAPSSGRSAKQPSIEAHSESNEDRREMSKRTFLENKLKLEVGKLKNEPQKKPKAKAKNHNKAKSKKKLKVKDKDKAKTKSKPAGGGFKAKLHKKIQKQRAQEDKQPVPRPNQYNQVPSTVAVQSAELYNPAYMGGRGNMHYAQYTGSFGHPGMYMNRLPMKEGEIGIEE